MNNVMLHYAMKYLASNISEKNLKFSMSWELLENVLFLQIFLTICNHSFFLSFVGLNYFTSGPAQLVA